MEQGEHGEHEEHEEVQEVRREGASRRREHASSVWIPPSLGVWGGSLSKRGWQRLDVCLPLPPQEHADVQALEITVRVCTHARCMFRPSTSTLS